MSVPKDFLSNFCQSPPPPIRYTEQDVIDNFIKFIQTECAKIPTPQKLVTYKMEQNFLTTFSRQQFWAIIENALSKQMGFTRSRYQFTFNHEYTHMAAKTYHFVKTEISYQYNEDYRYDSWCDFSQIPDGIVMKFYIP